MNTLICIFPSILDKLSSVWCGCQGLTSVMRFESWGGYFQQIRTYISVCSSHRAVVRFRRLGIWHMSHMGFVYDTLWCFFNYLFIYFLLELDSPSSYYIALDGYEMFLALKVMKLHCDLESTEQTWNLRWHFLYHFVIWFILNYIMCIVQGALQS